MDDMKKKMADQFSTIVQRGMYQDADEMLSELRKSVDTDDYLSEDLCVTAAFLYNRLGKRDSELYYLKQGLLINPTSPSLFVSLADYYSKTNIQQELICLYQAVFYADRSGDTDQASFIGNIIEALEKNNVSVPGTSIVILSYNTKDYIRQCLESIRNTVFSERCQVIVVDNASTDGSIEYLRTLDWITLIENDVNHGFPGGCNDGIKAADMDNDIYLLNSDTVLPYNALFWLKMGLYENDNVGSTGSVTNYAANGQNVILTGMKSLDEYISYGQQTNVLMDFPYKYKTFLIGFSLLIKRSVLNEVGLLDERFNPGNSEDVDLGFRILKYGKLNVLCLNSFVFHYGSRSFAELQKSGQDYGDLLKKNDAKLQEKLGFDPWSYHKYRTDLFEEIKADRTADIHILEIGCGLGATASLIKTQFPDAEYTGIERNESVASYANAFGDVRVGDIESIDLDDKYKGYFDYVLLGDVLQYTYDPDSVLKKISEYLKKKGRVLISVPNIRHWSVIIPLLSDDRFEYTGDGIVNKDSIRFFTENDAARRISGNGYSIKKIKTAVSKNEPSEEEIKYLRSLAELSEQPDIDDFMVAEYIYTAEKSAW